jgi:hypothetical protein
MKMIFEEGWVRSLLLGVTQMGSTRGKNDWIRDTGPRMPDSRVSFQVSLVIVSIGPLGYGIEELKIRPARCSRCPRADWTIKDASALALNQLHEKRIGCLCNIQWQCPQIMLPFLFDKSIA